jgi:hypothetical protein
MRRTFLLLFSVAVALLLASGALAASNVGYRDFSFAASGLGGAATSMMAQSKLWFNDGLWWGIWTASPSPAGWARPSSRVPPTRT